MRQVDIDNFSDYCSPENIPSDWVFLAEVL